MVIALGSDHRGYALKEFLKRALTERGYTVEDFGTDSPERTDYPIYAKAVGKAVVEGRADYGVLICATGIGMSIAANKVRGVRAAHVCNDELVKLSRQHNNANVLCFGSLYTDEETALRWVETFVKTEFEGGRHARRVSMLEEG